MQIHLNGQPHPVPEGTTLAQLIDQLKLAGPVAVELNAVVVRRARHPEVELKDGDRVEVVTFVGGGA